MEHTTYPAMWCKVDPHFLLHSSHAQSETISHQHYIYVPPSTINGSEMQSSYMVMVEAMCEVFM